MLEFFFTNDSINTALLMLFEKLGQFWYNVCFCRIFSSNPVLCQIVTCLVGGWGREWLFSSFVLSHSSRDPLSLVWVLLWSLTVWLPPMIDAKREEGREEKGAKMQTCIDFPGKNTKLCSIIFRESVTLKIYRTFPTCTRQRKLCWQLCFSWTDCDKSHDPPPPSSSDQSHLAPENPWGQRMMPNPKMGTGRHPLLSHTGIKLIAIACLVGLRRKREEEDN